MLFNEFNPIIGNSFDQPNESDYPDVCFKYADIYHVMNNTTDYVKNVLLNIIPLSNKKKLLVDIKVHDLDIDDVACIPGWHYDATTTLDKLTYTDYYHLFVSGNSALTEFQKNPIDISAKNIDDVKTFCDDKSFACFSIPSCTIVTYNSLNLHRGVKAKSKEKRLLIRIVETDNIQSNNKPFKPSKYK